MTSISPSTAENLPTAASDALPQSTGWAAIWRPIEQRLAALVDRANPILVKETRQALKSRQFIATFFIVLIACWLTTIGGVAIVGPEIYYVAAGSQMLIAYYAILAFPLAVIVPFSAFRSLASEQEDNTYDLLSITTLSPQQIITGKLGSAAVQMAVYLSAVSPCIAFTFLLRGVDALCVAVILVYTILGSLGLSMLALMAGTIAKVRYMQVIVSVALVLALAGIFLSAIGMTAGFLQWGQTFSQDSDFWVAAALFLTCYLTNFALLHAAAAAIISFPSENRSTPLRRRMLLQQACLVGWLAVSICMEGFEESINVASVMGCIVGGINWYVAGILLTSEWPLLSRRVQRSLPQSTTGRAFLTWFNPGPGTGYMFCIANLGSMVVCGLLLVLFSSPATTRVVGTDQAVYSLILTMGYVVLYLGTGHLLIKLLRRFIFVSMLAGVLIHAVLLLAGVGIPMVIHQIAHPMSGGYSLLHVTNPFWTLYEVLDSGVSAIETETATLLVSAAALVVFLLNLRSVAIELSYQRTALPQRVVEEEAELHPLPAQKPRNPWDADEAEK